MSQVVGNPHDQLFREMFSRKETAMGFVQAYWPSEVVAQMDLETLECVRESFVDEELRTSQSDLIYRIQWAKKPAYLYLLLEHQSKPDRWMPLRLLGYMVRLWNRWLQEEGSKGRRKKLPPILPLVLHQGKSGWKVSRQFFEIIEGDKNVSLLLQRYLPQFEYEVVDLSHLSLEKLQGELLGKLTLGLMKAVAENQIDQAWPQIALWMRDVLTKQTALEVIELWLRYLTGTTHKSINELHNLLTETVDAGLGENMMTLAERLRKEGEKKGQIEKGIATAKNLLKMGLLTVDQIAEATQLPIQEIKKLSQSSQT